MRCFCIFILLSLGWWNIAAAEKPNIIIMLADDLGWGDVGFNGRSTWQTPNLDRLAREGIRFARWYAAGTVCAPTRAALLTGKYGIHNGVTGNNDDLPRAEVTLAEALKRQGYATCLSGKWHHGRPRPGESSYVHPMDQGFDEFFGFTNARAAWEHFPKKLWDGRAEKPVAGYADTLFTDRGLDFIERHRDRPFLLYVAYTATHLHIEAPEAEIAKHRGKFTEADPAKPLNATYAAMVTQLDHEVGRILATLQRLNLDQRTLVIFASDHGATFETNMFGTTYYHDSNAPFRGQKRTLWEGGLRVPGVARWPGRLPAGVTLGEPVHHIDVLPTALAAAGTQADPGWQVDGVNLLPWWEGKAPAPKRTLFWEWRVEGANILAAMRGPMKLVVFPQQPPELYDVERDPAERRTLAPDQRPLVQELQKELQAWLATETAAAKAGRVPLAK